MKSRIQKLLRKRNDLQKQLDFSMQQMQKTENTIRLTEDVIEGINEQIYHLLERKNQMQHNTKQCSHKQHNNRRPNQKNSNKSNYKW